MCMDGLLKNINQEVQYVVKKERKDTYTQQKHSDTSAAIELLNILLQNLPTRYKHL